MNIEKRNINSHEVEPHFIMSNAEMAALKAFNGVLEETVKTWQLRSSFMKELIKNIERHNN